jgi:hypothetical protein
MFEQQKIDPAKIVAACFPFYIKISLDNRALDQFDYIVSYIDISN